MIRALRAAAGDVLGARALDVPADAHATGAKDAAVVIHAEEAVRVVHVPLRKAIIVADVVHALAPGEGLQFAMAVGNAHGADMIPLGEQQFQRHAPVFSQPLAVGFDLHAFGDFGGAGGKQLRHAGHFHQAQAAGAHVIDAVQVAQGRDFHAGLFRRLQNGCAFLGADFLAVNR